MHVTLRVRPHVPHLRHRKRFALVRRALERFCSVDLANGAGCRVAHFVVLGNHMHLVVEADSAAALSKGVQKLTLSISRRLSALSVRNQGGSLRHGGVAFSQRPGWLGRVFQERYHARALGTPSEVRNAIRYVYANAEHHFGSAAQPSGVVDPYSSAEHVLSGAVLGSAGRRARAGPRGSADRGDVLPVVRARGWLLDRGWRRAGAIPGLDGR